MPAKFIFLALAAIFVVAAGRRRFRGAQARIWLTVAAIFIVVSAWLFLRS